jgi:hypothetical protein
MSKNVVVAKNIDTAEQTAKSSYEHVAWRNKRRVTPRPTDSGSSAAHGPTGENEDEK